MDQSIEQFLDRYVARKRWMMAWTAMLWALCFALLWRMSWRLLNHWLALHAGAVWLDKIIGITAVAAIVLPKLWLLFQKYDPVTEATEVERLRSVFDQRLITLASAQPGSALIDCLRAEVEVVIQQTDTKSLVSTRPLWWALAAVVLSAIL